jgi:hypothetical protein
MLVVFGGCATKLETLDAPASFQGTLTKGGKPVGDVVLKLQPTEAGYMTEMPVAADGKFKGEAIPGKYMYFVGKGTSKSSEQVVKSIDGKFSEPSTDRLVTVAPGQDLSVTLD